MKGPRLPRWLYPGMHLKRWLAAPVRRHRHPRPRRGDLRPRSLPGDQADTIPIVYWLTGAWLEPEVRAALVALLGILLTGIGMWGLMRSVVSPFVAPRRQRHGGALHEALPRPRPADRRDRRRHRPLDAAARPEGLQRETSPPSWRWPTTAAAVGQLRQQLGIVPPGDIRNCIAALADAEPLMTQLMQYRFPAGPGLDNHAFGNLFIAAMTAVTGDFEEAVRESNRVLAVRGQVLPATSVPLNLSAQLGSGRQLYGQVAIATAEEPIERVFIEPDDVRANRGGARARSSRRR